jgi:hypothetical protein
VPGRPPIRLAALGCGGRLVGTLVDAVPGNEVSSGRLRQAEGADKGPQ